jgi:hypothetical protein
VDEGGVLGSSYLRLVERGACLHSRADLPPDLAWVEWPSWDGGAVHALARRTRGRWRTTLLRTTRGQGPGDVMRRLRERTPEPGAPVLVERPDADRARIVLGALCGDLSGILELALRGSDVPADGPVLAAAESHHARQIAPLVELLHGSDAVDAFGECAAGRIHPDAVSLLTAPDETGEVLRGLRRTHPLVARLALSSTLVVRALCAGEGIHAALAVPCPGYTPAHMRRAAGATLGPIALQVPLAEGILPDEADVLRHARATARLAAALPSEWMPRDAASWTALATLAATVGASAVLGPETLRRSKGDWTGLVDRLARAAVRAPGSPRQVSAALAAAAADLGEVRQALLRQVVLPLSANASHRLAFPGGEDVAEAEIAADRGMRAVDALLWSDKDIGSCLAIGREWRARRDGIDRAVADPEADGGTEGEWAGLGAAFVHDGVEVVPITDALSLWEEGAATPDRSGAAGLDHCIYTRLRIFRAGHAHGLSVRRAADGARLSTAQVAVVDGVPVLREHRGLRNADPEPGAHAALAAFLEGLAGGAFGELPAAPARRQLADGLWDLCGYDWRRESGVAAALEAWAPLLPRWMRGLTPGHVFEVLVSRRLLDPVA